MKEEEKEKNKVNTMKRNTSDRGTRTQPHPMQGKERGERKREVRERKRERKKERERASERARERAS